MKRLCLLMLALALMLSGTTAWATDEEPVEIVVVYSNLEEDQQQVWWDYIFNPFIEKHPNVTIDFQCIPNTAETVRVQFAAGVGPDVTVLDCYELPDVAESGRIIPLDEYNELYHWDEILFDWAFKAGYYGDKLYALSHTAESTGMYVNMTLLNELGCKLPTTREEYVAACEAAISAGYIAVAYGYSGFPASLQFLYDHYVPTYAGNDKIRALFSGEIGFDDPDITGAFALIKSDWDAGYINDKKSAAITLEESNTLFNTGRALFNPQGTWLSMSNVPPGTWKFDWEYIAWPSMRDGIPPAGCFGVGQLFMINVNAERPDLCAGLIDMFFNDEQNMANAMGSGMETIARSIDASLYPADMHPDISKTLAGQDVIFSDPNVGWCPWYAYPPRTNQYIYDNFDKVLHDRSSLEDFLSGAQAVLDQEIADGFVFDY